MFVWLNGRYIGENEARISYTDRGFLLGDGVFETIRLQAGRLRRSKAHGERLEKGLSWLGIMPPDWTEIENIALTLAARNRLSSAVIRVTVSRGSCGPGLNLKSGLSPTVLITAIKLPTRPKSVHLALCETAHRAGLASESFKLTQYAQSQQARRWALERGADMGVLTHIEDQSLVCADCANLFWIDKDSVYTPSLSLGALPGTTRQSILTELKKRKIKVECGRFKKDMLASAEACFITNSILGVMPVHQIDGESFVNHHPVLDEIKNIECDQT